MPIKPKHLTISRAIELRKKNPTKNRRPVNEILKETKEKGYEGWDGCNGGVNRYRKIYKEYLNDRPLNFILEKLKVKEPQIMILGPGEGYDSALFKRELHEFGVDAHMDTLGFSKTVESELFASKDIRNDYSPHISKAIPFEHINPIEHPQLVKEIQGKYHLVIASNSIGYYAESNSYALFQSSLLLTKGGRAYIDLNYTKPLKEIMKVTERMINAYNKANKTSLKFRIKGLEDTYFRETHNDLIYVQIDRIE